MQIAIVLYPGMTALDAIGPYEVLRQLPGAQLRFVGAAVGPVAMDSNVLHLGVTHTFAETPTPDLVLVPGGTIVASAMNDAQLTGWLREVHETTQWTTSVCTGAMILAAAGLLGGKPATTHWLAQSALGAMGAKPQREKRIVRDGKIITAAGVSAGIDLALWLAGEIAGRQVAQAIQLGIEYDPHPPFDSGHPSKASRTTAALARTTMISRSASEPEVLAATKVAWRRTLEAFRTTHRERS